MRTPHEISHEIIYKKTNFNELPLGMASHLEICIEEAIHAERNAPGRRKEEGSLIHEPQRGTRLAGPHGGFKEKMPNPSDNDLKDPFFEAIWQATKTWDVNAPEYYAGYCGTNGSHVMLILNSLRKVLAARQEINQELHLAEQAVIYAVGDYDSHQKDDRFGSRRRLLEAYSRYEATRAKTAGGADE